MRSFETSNTSHTVTCIECLLCKFCPLFIIISLLMDWQPVLSPCDLLWPISRLALSNPVCNQNAVCAWFTFFGGVHVLRAVQPGGMLLGMLW